MIGTNLRGSYCCASPTLATCCYAGCYPAPIVKISARAELKSKNPGFPKVEAGQSGLIALSGANLGDVGLMLMQNNLVQAEILAHEWANLFPNRFYIEVQRVGHANAEMLVQRSLALASTLHLAGGGDTIGAVLES